MTPSPSAVPPHPPIHLPSSPTAYKFSYRLINTSLTTPLPSDPPNADGTPYIGDYETMRQMRVECGWGLERLEKEWVDEKGNYPFWIFYLRPIKGGADYRGSEEPAGTARDTSLHTNGTATDSISANSENPLSTGITPSHIPPPSLAQTSASSTAYPATPTSTSMVTDDESEEDRNTYKQGDILVGMGGLVLDLENDQGMASRAEGRVKLASLFIYNSHRSLSLGSLSFQTLQNLATSPPYNANHLTLDTMPFQMIMDEEEVDERGRKMWGRPRWVELGDEEGEARNMKWYRRMGYREFRPRIDHLYPNPFIKDPEDPDHLLPSAYLSRVVER